MPHFILHVAAAATAGALVLAAAQPIMTDDVWWHLAMGEHYAVQGPWLAADPLLHTATAPAAPAAWLFDVALHATSRIAGLQGLRAVHAGLVVLILALAWSWLRRTSQSSAIASVGTIAFVQLAAYRLVQLRPHLATIAFALLLLHLIASNRAPPSWRQCALVVLVCGVWANVHAAFVLGPLLLASAAMGAFAGSFGGGATPDAARKRAFRLALLCALATAATLANPLGPDQLLHYFSAGQSSPSLELVRDEWAPLRLLAWPPANLPPSLLAWAIAWGIVVALALLLALELRVRLTARLTADPGEGAQPTASTGIDPALAAMALTSVVFMLMAVRFLWLGILPIAAIGQWLSMRSPTMHGGRSGRLVAGWVAAGAMLVLVPASFRIGDWPMIAQGVQSRLYGRAYPAIKYHAHAVWILADANLEGRLFNSYFMGNFLGYWLAPRMQAFANGSLNLPPETMEDHHALMMRSGGRAAAIGGDGAEPAETFGELLDRHGVDVFLGEGLPVQARPNRPVEYTTSHLEGTPGWIQIFRNVHGSIFLRAGPHDDPPTDPGVDPAGGAAGNARSDPRNAENLRRVARYYEREGVPFDPVRGFIVADVVREAPRFAELHAVVPTRFAVLQRSAYAADPMKRRAAQLDLASVLLLVGEYDRAAVLLRQVVEVDPGNVAAQRRLVWTLLHAERLEEARRAARALLEAAPANDGFSEQIAGVALRSDTLAPESLRALVASLPAFTRAEMRSVFHGYIEPEPRPLRMDRFATQGDPG